LALLVTVCMSCSPEHRGTKTFFEICEYHDDCTDDVLACDVFGEVGGTATKRCLGDIGTSCER
jgi:hypothetical protein